jgi:hypothetical protein
MASVLATLDDIVRQLPDDGAERHAAAAGTGLTAARARFGRAVYPLTLRRLMRLLAASVDGQTVADAYLLQGTAWTTVAADQRRAFLAQARTTIQVVDGSRYWAHDAADVRLTAPLWCDATGTFVSGDDDERPVYVFLVRERLDARHRRPRPPSAPSPAPGRRRRRLVVRPSTAKPRRRRGARDVPARRKSLRFHVTAKAYDGEQPPQQQHATTTPPPSS